MAQWKTPPQCKCRALAEQVKTIRRRKLVEILRIEAAYFLFLEVIWKTFSVSANISQCLKFLLPLIFGFLRSSWAGGKGAKVWRAQLKMRQYPGGRSVQGGFVKLEKKLKLPKKYQLNLSTLKPWWKIAASMKVPPRKINKHWRGATGGCRGRQPASGLPCICPKKQMHAKGWGNL